HSSGTLIVLHAYGF
ncbi:hypothetical protein CPC197_0287B, partial [Chlamydia psittaci C1/97]